MHTHHLGFVPSTSRILLRRACRLRFLASVLNVLTVTTPLATLALASLAVVSPAAAQWTAESPRPTYLNVNGVAATSPTHVFLATADDSFDDGGALFESTDGGDTFVQRDVPFSLGSGLNGLFFLDEQHGWAWGNVNYRTLDGGATWTELPLLGSTYFMDFFSPSFGLATGNFGVMTSSDGGLSWSSSPHGIFTLDFADGSTGLGASAAGIYRTADGGATFIQTLEGEADDVAFLTSTVAVAIVDGGFQRSTDGGLTWLSGPDALLRDRVEAISSDTVLAWSASGSFPDPDERILRSTDGGQTWSDLGELLPAGVLAWAIPALSVVVGADLDGGLWRSTDGGATFSQVFVSPGPRPGFIGSSRPVFADATTGYFAYGPGFVLKTVDGGSSWQQISSGSAHNLAGLARFDDGSMVAVGEAATWIRGAASDRWQIVPAPGAGDFMAVEVIGPADALMIDDGGQLFHSTDQGAVWTPAPTPAPGLIGRDLAFTTALDGWATGSSFSTSALQHTTDGGATWTPVDGVLGDYRAVDVVGAGVWAGRSDGWVQRSTDGGLSWTAMRLPGPSPSLRDLDFSSPSSGFAAGAGGYAARTTDGGATWQALPTPDSSHVFVAVEAVGADEVWLATAAGGLLHSANGGANWSQVDADPGATGFGSYGALAVSPSGLAWVAGSRGSIRRFNGPLPPPLNQPPDASFTFAAAGQTVDFTDTSSDLDGSIVAWAWDFGDGNVSSVQHPSHTYTTADTFHVLLTVTDDDGATDIYGRFVVAQPGPGGTFGDFEEVTPPDPLFVTPQDEDFWVTTTAPGDYDGDGDLDVAVLGFYVVYNTSVQHRLVLFRNDGEATPTRWSFTYVDLLLDTPVGTLSAGASDMAWGDADGDGDLDLVVGSNGLTVLYRNDDAVLTPTATVLPPYGEDNFQADFDLDSISWADFDNDGDLDLLVPSVFEPGTGYRTALLRNDGIDGGVFIFTEVQVGLAATRHAQSTWADDDGDEDLDLLLINQVPNTGQGFIHRYRNDGGGLFTAEPLLDGLKVEHGEAEWGDADADGDLDILIAGRTVDAEGVIEHAMVIHRNDGGVYTRVEVIGCPACDGWYDLVATSWADYDSDGDVDILVAGTYHSGQQIEGRAKVFVGDGTGFLDSGGQLPAPLSSGSRGGTFGWLDLDGDGDLDYFIAGQYYVPGGNGLVEAQMHVYRNDIDVQNQPPMAPTLPSAQVEEGGTVRLFWNPSTDDLTPSHALTYDLSLYRGGLPVETPRREPRPGSLDTTGSWTLEGLAAGDYTWQVRAVDSAFNAGPPAGGTFTVGQVLPAEIFTDGFESGDLSSWGQ